MFKNFTLLLSRNFVQQFFSIANFLGAERLTQLDELLNPRCTFSDRKFLFNGNIAVSCHPVQEGMNTFRP